MEGIVIILLILLLYLINKLSRKIDQVERKIDHINSGLKGGALAVDRAEPETKQTPQTAVTQKPPVLEEKPTKEKDTEVHRPVVAQSQAPKVTAVPPNKVKPKAPPRPSFMERNPDLEKFIGENLLSKVGIVIFVIGMGFLVKLGIDNDVITESMRVAIGILIGGGMIGLAHYMRTSFAKFSSILIGGALAVLYFTIALAFHEYALIPQIAAFIIMVLITAFAVLLAISYDRKELAVLALIGGFGTPFFVSTGSGNYSVLLTYILILDIGMLALVYYKKWNLINYLAYGLTYLLFIGVYISEFIDNEDATRLTLILFLTSYYLIFFLMTIIYNIKNTRKFEYSEIGMLLTNSSLYFGLGLSLIHGFKDGLYSGVFTALVAIFNFGFAFSLYIRKEIDKNLLFLLIGLVLTFVSLIAPIQLEGNYITMFWAIEAVLLFWLSQKSGIKLMTTASVLVTILMLISLTIDWQQNYYPNYDYVVLSLFLNKVFIASFVVMASLAGLTLLMKKDEVIEIKGTEIVWKRIYTRGMFGVVFYLGFLLELNYQFIRFEFEDSLRVILLGIYNYSYVMIVLAVQRFQPSKILQKLGIALSALAIFSYLTVYLYQVIVSRSYYLLDSGVSTGFYWHYVLLVLFVLILINLYRHICKTYNFKSKLGVISLWVLAFIGIFVTSAEVSHLSLMYQYGSDKSELDAFDTTVKSVYPVIWALSALVLMVVGMKLRLKALRIASLILFSITIVKLFFYDLAGNSTGKIISFILLGVILLLISFLYQKLKFIIQDDDKNN